MRTNTTRENSTVGDKVQRHLTNFSSNKKNLFDWRKRKICRARFLNSIISNVESKCTQRRRWRCRLVLGADRFDIWLPTPMGFHFNRENVAQTTKATFSIRTFRSSYRETRAHKTNENEANISKNNWANWRGKQVPFIHQSNSSKWSLLNVLEQNCCRTKFSLQWNRSSSHLIHHNRTSSEDRRFSPAISPLLHWKLCVSSEWQVAEETTESLSISLPTTFIQLSTEIVRLRHVV